MYFFPQYARHMANTDLTVKGIFEFKPAAKCVDRDAVGKAIADSFLRCAVDNPSIDVPPGNDVWTNLYQNQHREIIEFIRSYDLNAIIDYFENIHEKSFTTGILDTGLNPDETARNSWALTICSRLTAIAESLGAIPLYNPFASPGVCNAPPDLNMYQYDLNHLLSLIEQKLGRDILLPDVFNGFGIKTYRGIITDRIGRALLTACQIKNYCHLLSIDFRTAKLCEIGGGGGMLAYFCWQLGARNYTIFDLPTTNILQNYFLLNALPTAKIVTYDRYEGIENGCINILPYWKISDCLPGYADLFINEDSMPEIDRNIVLSYLDYIKAFSRYFLSLNQECNAVMKDGNMLARVYELIEESGGFERLLRQLHWGMPGYSVELYRVVQPNQMT